MLNSRVVGIFIVVVGLVLLGFAIGATMTSRHVAQPTEPLPEQPHATSIEVVMSNIEWFIDGFDENRFNNEVLAGTTGLELVQASNGMVLAYTPNELSKQFPITANLDGLSQAEASSIHGDVVLILEGGLALTLANPEAGFYGPVLFDTTGVIIYTKDLVVDTTGILMNTLRSPEPGDIIVIETHFSSRGEVMGFMATFVGSAMELSSF